MENLEKNIQKNNMKKLVLSGVLGMFCYNTNNVAMEMVEKEEINGIENVLKVMIEGEKKIIKKRKEIQSIIQNIYFSIKEKEEEEDNKEEISRLWKFLKKEIFPNDQEDVFSKKRKIIEMHFPDLDKEDQSIFLPEMFNSIFGEAKEKNKGEEIKEEDKKKIKEYFNEIIEAEIKLIKKVKEYYKKKIKEKFKIEKEEKEEILENIQEEFYKEKIQNVEEGEEDGIRIEKAFSEKVFSLISTEKEEEKKEIFSFIKKRIKTWNQNNGIIKSDILDFIKQLINLEDFSLPKESSEEKEKEKEKVSCQPIAVVSQSVEGRSCCCCNKGKEEKGENNSKKNDSKTTTGIIDGKKVKTYKNI